MFEKLEIFQMAQAMSVNAAARQSLISENVANADTPGYKARDMPSFAETYRENGKALILRKTRPQHIGTHQTTRVFDEQTFLTDGNESPNGNSVSLETEMVKAAEIRQQNDLAITVYKSALGILRTSLGRR